MYNELTMKNIITVGILIALALTAYRGYQYFTNHKLTSPSTQNIEIPKDEWSTYTNNKWGYSLRYPQDIFSHCDLYNSENVAAFFYKGVYPECPAILDDDTMSHFNIIVKDLLESNAQDAALLGVEDYLIGNKVGNISQYQVSEEKSVTNDPIYYLVELPLGEKKLSILWLSSDEELLRDILETFEFTSTETEER